MNSLSQRSRSRSLQRLRRWIATVVLAIIAYCILQAWFLEGVFRPVRVISGSMAYTLLGPHWLRPCRQCHFPIICGKDNPPEQSLVVCPNCGYAQNELLNKHSRPGQRVLIDKATTNFKSLSRWQAVVVRDPLDSRKLIVKRVIGLPHEHVALRDGDVYINGVIARKTLRHLRELYLPVHDDRFRPDESLELPARWQADDIHSGWQTTAKGYRWTAKGLQKPILDKIDWLSYRHWHCMVSPVDRTEKSEIMDQYGYNQGLSRQLNRVTDILLEVRAKMAGTGKLLLIVRDGIDSFQVALSPQNNSIELMINDKVSVRSKYQSPGNEKDISIECGLCDHQFLLSIDRQLVISHPYTSFGAAEKENFIPLAIGSVRLEVELRNLKIFRDIYYLNPQRNRRNWELSEPLNSEQIFLLGDNCPVSLDSRNWPNGGGVSRKLLVGRLLKISRSRKIYGTNR